MATGAARRVEGVHLVAYLGKWLDLGSVGTHVGRYSTTMGSASHDVYDVPVSAFHEFVQDNIPNTIASDVDFTVLRLYVPISYGGRISDIGVMNGVYKAPSYPHVPRNGVIYTAPADEEKYRARAPAREVRPHLGVGYREEADAWHPHDGDRFHVTEVD